MRIIKATILLAEETTLSIYAENESFRSNKTSRPFIMVKGFKVKLSLLYRYYKLLLFCVKNTIEHLLIFKLFIKMV